MTDKIGIFSFFSGAGFLDLGFELAGGYKVLFVNEFHKPFMDTYKYSREKMGIEIPEFGYHLGDVAKYLEADQVKELKTELKNAKEKCKLVGFIGGPPCPDFSVGGKNKGREGDNGKLTKTYIDLISKIKPDFFLFENVKGLYSTVKHRVFFEEMKEKLRRSGYCITERLINALEYGAPQNRERIILIGFRTSVLKNYKVKVKSNDVLPGFNWEEHLLYSMEQIQEFPWPTENTFENNGVRECPQGVPRDLTVEYWFQKNNVISHPNAMNYFQPRAGLARFQTVAEGDDSKKSYKRPHRWRYSPTAAYGNNEVHLHPYKERRLSVAEALAIQSLPVEYEVPSELTLSDMFKTVGNGVPFLAAKGLANTIHDYVIYLENNKEHEETNSK
ncbi:DNA cytosine methyltransferase [Butyricimonas virosa]|jgi:DNA (cytosine-5-)-methyltransferase|uniref:DNA cytosine methyltransferase n=1 Tax=Butyricimonas virosa TaxID=544645 RepID=UPI003AAE62DA